MTIREQIIRYLQLSKAEILCGTFTVIPDCEFGFGCAASLSVGYKPDEWRKFMQTCERRLDAWDDNKLTVWLTDGSWLTLVDYDCVISVKRQFKPEIPKHLK